MDVLGQDAPLGVVQLDTGLRDASGDCLALGPEIVGQDEKSRAEVAQKLADDASFRQVGAGIFETEWHEGGGQSERAPLELLPENGGIRRQVTVGTELRAAVAGPRQFIEKSCIRK